MFLPVIDRSLSLSLLSRREDADWPTKDEIWEGVPLFALQRNKSDVTVLLCDVKARILQPSVLLIVALIVILSVLKWMSGIV